MVVKIWNLNLKLKMGGIKHHLIWVVVVIVHLIERNPSIQRTKKGAKRKIKKFNQNRVKMIAQLKLKINMGKIKNNPLKRRIKKIMILMIVGNLLTNQAIHLQNHLIQHLIIRAKTKKQSNKNNSLNNQRF